MQAVPGAAQARPSRIQVGLVGGGDTTLSLVESLAGMEFIDVVGVYPPLDFPAGLPFRRFDDLPGLLAAVGAGAVVVSDQSFLPDVMRSASPETGVIWGASFDLLAAMAQEVGKFLTILNAVQEGVQLADAGGVLRYVNPAFTSITGVPASERIGRSIFEVSPDGALVKALKTGRKVFGLRNRSVGSTAEVLSNASPIFAGGKMTGAVVVFQDISKIIELTQALQERNLVIERLTSKLEELHGSEYTFDDMIGTSKAIRDAVDVARKVALSDATVLIHGESGTGKEIFAHAIHDASPRRRGPFIRVNCAAIPDNLMESEIFGHEKGAFTGASRTKIGRFELADGGSILLDEIGELGATMQAKLLRVLQFRQFERLGGVRPITVDVRIIAATNRDLRADIAEGRFREDLFYRLNVITIDAPPLRARKEDIPPLVGHFITHLNRRLGKRVAGVSPEAMAVLMEYPWPGNVRELANMIEKAMLLHEEEYLPAGAFRADLSQGLERPPAEPDAVGDLASIASLERDAIERALRRYGSSSEGKRRAAQALGISLTTLYNKMRQYRTQASGLKNP